MDLNNTRPPDFTTVTIVKLISPCKMTVLYSNFPATRLEELELEMGESWEEDMPFSRENGPMPQLEMFVTVREDNGTCKRGYIKRLFGQCAEVFLCDYGTLVFIDELVKVKPLKVDYRRRLRFRSTIVIIPGLVPGKVVPFAHGDKIMPIPCWSREARSATNAWFSEGVSMSVFHFKNPAVTYADFYKGSPLNSYSSYMLNRKVTLLDHQKFQETILPGGAKDKVEVEPETESEDTTGGDEKMKIMEIELEDMRTSLDKLTLEIYGKDQQTESLTSDKSKLEEEVKEVRHRLEDTIVQLKNALTSIRTFTTREE